MAYDWPERVRGTNKARKLRSRTHEIFQVVAQHQIQHLEVSSKSTIGLNAARCNPQSPGAFRENLGSPGLHPEFKLDRPLCGRCTRRFPGLQIPYYANEIFRVQPTVCPNLSHLSLRGGQPLDSAWILGVGISRSTSITGLRGKS